MKNALAMLMSAGLLGLCTTAQAGVVDLTEEQIALNNQAYAAREAGDLKKAEKLAEATLEIQEIDFLWLQLGRIYEEEGKCVSAINAYNKVADSNTTVELPHAEVLSILADSYKSYENTCSSGVVLRCSDDVSVRIDDYDPIQCSPTPVPLTVGPHNIIATSAYGSTTARVEGFPGKISDIELKIVNYEKIATDAGVTTEQLEAKSRNMKIAGWTLVGVGAAALISGGAIYAVGDKNREDKLDDYKEDPFKYQKDIDDANDLKNVGMWVMIGGSVVGVAGAVVLIVDAVQTNNRREAHANRNFMLTPYFNAEGAGMGLSYTF